MLVLDHLRTAACIIHFYSYLFVSFLFVFWFVFILVCFLKERKAHPQNKILLIIWLITLDWYPLNRVTDMYTNDFPAQRRLSKSTIWSCLVMTSSLCKKKPKKNKQNEVNKSKVLTIQFRVTWNVESFFRSCACSFIWVPMSFLIIFLHINVCPI